MIVDMSAPVFIRSVERVDMYNWLKDQGGTTTPEKADIYRATHPCWTSYDQMMSAYQNRSDKVKGMMLFSFVYFFDLCFEYTNLFLFLFV